MKIVTLIAFIIGIIFFMPWIVMSLWNYLMPILLPAVAFGTISYWQAWGLMIFTRLLVYSGNGSK